MLCCKNLVKTGDRGVTKTLIGCIQGLVSCWRHWPNLPLCVCVCGYNECHTGPQQVLCCFKGPGIIWIGACAIAIYPSPSSIPANCHTGVHKHCCPSVGQNTGQAPVTAVVCIQNYAFWLYVMLAGKDHKVCQSLRLFKSTFKSKQRMRRGFISCCSYDNFFKTPGNHNYKTNLK